MLQPVGPLDDEVYWRRRLVALVGVVLVVTLLVWGLAALLGGGSDAAAAPAPVATPEVVPVASGLATPPGVASGVLAPPAGTALGPTIPGAAAPPSGLPTMSAAPTPSPAPGTTPAPPARCSDRVLTVRARTDAPTYGAGADPLLSLVVVNHGSVPCTRDLDAARQGIAVVRTPKEGLWASDDCSPGHTDDVRTLVPGQEVVFAVRWAGRTSAPGCSSASRREVPDGSYQVLARLDRIVSTGVRFDLDR